MGVESISSLVFRVVIFRAWFIIVLWDERIAFFISVDTTPVFGGSLQPLKLGLEILDLAKDRPG